MSQPRKHGRIIAITSCGPLKIRETAASVSASLDHIMGFLLTSDLACPVTLSEVLLVTGVGKAPSGYDPSCSCSSNCIGRFETKSGNFEVCGRVVRSGVGYGESWWRHVSRGGINAGQRPTIYWPSHKPVRIPGALAWALVNALDVESTTARI